MLLNKVLRNTFGILIWILMTMNCTVGQEKFSVTIKIRNNSKVDHQGETFFLIGSFSGWKPNAVEVGKIPALGQSIEVTVSGISAGNFEYKFMRGDWARLACTADGRLEGPLEATISSDTVLTATIDGWRDDFPLSTASPQVHVLDSAFYFPNLDLHRKVWIYLPKDYSKTKKKYPVIYMHDGQDLFDEATSRGRIGPLEWHVDEAIDRSEHDAIVIAIEHANDIDQRQNEYFVKPNKNFPNPVGEQYLKDIVHTLKPYVDKHYRTLKDKQHTAMAGSSVGGLLSFYAGLQYPEVFGNLGVLSPSIWLDEGNISKTLGSELNLPEIATQNYYFYGGGRENRVKRDTSRVQMHTDIKSIADDLKTKTGTGIQVSINPFGRHGAWYWQKAFPPFFEWWMANVATKSKRSTKN